LGIKVYFFSASKVGQCVERAGDPHAYTSPRRHAAALRRQRHYGGAAAEMSDKYDAVAYKKEAEGEMKDALNTHRFVRNKFQQKSGLGGAKSAGQDS